MKLGDIKIEALKLMFANYGDDITIEELSSPQIDENYYSYLVNMPGSLNRCFSDIEEKRILNVKSFAIKSEDCIHEDGAMTFNLNKIPDFYSIERVVYTSMHGEYVADFAYVLEGEKIVFKVTDGKFKVLYRPKLQRVTPHTDDNQELLIPDNIACQIPYFIKGELYRDDEPGEASEARNWYEATLETMAVKKSAVGKIDRVNTVFSMVDM